MSTLGTVLVVDDDDSIVWVLARLLRHLGYDVATALRGQEALDEVARRDTTPVCVLMDILMPGDDGISVAKQLRHLHPELPIILMGGSLSPSQQNDLAVQYGGFIPKPFSIPELSAVLERVLSTRRVAVPLAQEVSA
ncbi:MAG TPA: response regulator [Roseiflexaceae bacterium]|nr:response regulator [Roseiflexaceae bacterium]